MRKFFWYPLIGTIILSFFALKNLHIIPYQMVFIVNTVSLLFHFSFLSYFIFSITGKKYSLKLFSIGCFILTIILIISDIIYVYTTSFAFANSCLFLFALYYFREILIGTPNIVLKNNPLFYVCCGIFVGSGLVVAVSLMAKYLLALKVSKDNLYLLSAIGMFGYIILNLFFIKALLLCRTQRK